MFRILSAAIILTLVSCVEPVIRGKEVKGAAKGDEKRPDYDQADLKKRLWILPFSESYAWNDEWGDPISLQKPLHEILKKKFSEPEAPYVLTSPFAQGLDDFQVDSGSDPREIHDLAKASATSGYLVGDIVRVELQEKFLPDGLLKTKKYKIVLTLNYALYDSNSGRVLFRGEESEEHVEQRSDILRLEQAYPELAKRLSIMATAASKRLYFDLLPISSKMGWSGRVVGAENTRIYVNAGRKTGIKIGDVLKVIEPHKKIHDLESGRLVGQAPGRVKATLRVTQFFGLDGAVAVLQSGGAVMPGDIVELY